MANRHKSYDEVIAKKFENLEYAQGYLLHIVDDEKLSVEDALRETIKAMGLQSYANKSELSIQAVSDFVSGRSRWSRDKLAKQIDKVFKLEVKLSIVVPESNEAA